MLLILENRTTAVDGIMTCLVYRLCYVRVYLMNYGLSLGIKLSFSAVIPFNSYRRGFSSIDCKININYNNNSIIEWGLIGYSSCPTIID